MYKYNLTTVSHPAMASFCNCIGKFASLGRVLSWPLYHGAYNVPPAHTQLHGEAPVISLQSNPQPFNDRKLSGSLPSKLWVCVRACAVTHQHYWHRVSYNKRSGWWHLHTVAPVVKSSLANSYNILILLEEYITLTKNTSMAALEIWYYWTLEEKFHTFQVSFQTRDSISVTYV